MRTMIDEAETALLASGAILPAQISGGQRLDADTSGTRALMLAILEDAARCIVQGRGRCHHRKRVLATEAVAWVESDCHAWPFSFTNICDALAIDADAVRVRLLHPDFDLVSGSPRPCGERSAANRSLPPHRRPRPSAAA